MDNTTIILGTICVFIAIFLAVRFEYRRSSCQYGGADTGHNNHCQKTGAKGCGCLRLLIAPLFSRPSYGSA